MTTTHPLEAILHPQSVAVVGASSNPSAGGYSFTAPFLKYGFKGAVYPVNPKYSEILGMKAYPSLREIPGSVDYVISCVPAAMVLDMLEDCPQKGVKTVHLYTARFTETGRPEAAQLEQEILKRARKFGIRLIGPNCFGVYYPRHGMSFGAELPKESGATGLISQSGGGAREFINLALPRGVYFSKAISYGNALDLTESDFLDYLSQDPATKIILMYVEGVKDGKRFFDTLRRTTPTKPVIIIKGGRSNAGTRAVTSHTASLAGSMTIWKALVAQAGAISAENLEEMIDLAATFNFLSPIRGRRVGVVGGGGGTAVLSADQCEEAGLDVIPLPIEIREQLKSQGVVTWDWVSNPTDMSIRGDDKFSAGDMLQMMANHPNFDFLITMLGNPFRRGQQIIAAESHMEQYKLKGDSPKPLLAVVADINPSSDDDDESWKQSGEIRKQLIAANIPFYPSMGRAARAARKVIDYYQRRG